VVTAEYMGALLGVKRFTPVANQSTMSYLQQVDWVGQVVHRHNQVFDDLSLDDDVRTTITMYWAYATCNHDWAVSAWRPAGAASTTVEAVPFELVRNNVLSISLTETRTVFPFRMQVASLELDSDPDALGNPRFDLRASWADVRAAATTYTLDHSVEVLPLALRGLNIPPYYNYLSAVDYTSNRRQAKGVIIGHVGGAPRVLTSGAKYFIEKCLAPAIEGMAQLLSQQQLGTQDVGARGNAGVQLGSQLTQQSNQLDADTTLNVAAFPSPGSGGPPPGPDTSALLHALIAQLSNTPGGLDAVTAHVDAMRTARTAGDANLSPRPSDFQSGRPGGARND
jgi:hypothetical protein